MTSPVLKMELHVNKHLPSLVLSNISQMIPHSLLFYNYPRLPIIRSHNNVLVKKIFHNSFLSNYQSVKQINTTIICFNWFPDLLKRSQHIHGLKTIISIVLAYLLSKYLPFNPSIIWNFNVSFDIYVRVCLHVTPFLELVTSYLIFVHLPKIGQDYWNNDNYKRGGNVVSSEKCLKVPKMVIRSRKSKKDAQYVYGHKKKLTKRQRMIYKTLTIEIIVFRPCICWDRFNKSGNQLKHIIVVLICLTDWFIVIKNIYSSY
jgi:hypothetical protein